MNFININYDDCYFSEENGYLESRYVFIEGNSLEPDKEVYIGETGFGTGLNLLVLEDYLRELKGEKIKLTFTTVEKYPVDINSVVKSFRSLSQVSNQSLNDHIILMERLYNSLKAGWNRILVERDWGELTLNLFYGDALDSFEKYPVKNRHWFLDGHSPDKNPDMWSGELFKKVAENSYTGATFATFTSAGVVKRGLREAGFFVKRKKGFGKKRHMIIGML